MAYKTGSCYVCRQNLPVQSHHLHPLEFGGKADGPQVMLCATHHLVSHYEAMYYIKHGKYQEIDKTLPDTTEEGIRIRKIIKRIIRAKLHFDEQKRNGETDPNSDSRRITQISWENDEQLFMAHEVKRALGFKALDRAMIECMITMYKALLKRGKL